MTGVVSRENERRALGDSKCNQFLQGGLFHRGAEKQGYSYKEVQPREGFLKGGATPPYPGGSDGKESACSVGDLGSIPGLGRSPGRGHGSPPRYSCLENPHGQKSLEGYSPWGHKESDTNERLSTHRHNVLDAGITDAVEE